jgi:type IV pilus assembly protein PilZ
VTDTSQGILSLAVKDKGALYAAYIPFVRNGGLFLATKKYYKLNDKVFMLITLMEDNEHLWAVGRALWITPEGAQENRETRIGVQFREQHNGATSNKLEHFWLVC